MARTSERLNSLIRTLKYENSFYSKKDHCERFVSRPYGLFISDISRYFDHSRAIYNFHLEDPIPKFSFRSICDLCNDAVAMFTSSLIVNKITFFFLILRQSQV